MGEDEEYADIQKAVFGQNSLNLMAFTLAGLGGLSNTGPSRSRRSMQHSRAGRSSTGCITKTERQARNDKKKQAAKAKKKNR